LAVPFSHPGAALGQTGGPAREEILSYDVSIQVERDGWMEVTEEIRVRALGDVIRRGIYRDFPTSFPRQGGLGRIQAPFEVVRVLRDGRAEPHVLQSVGGPARRGGIRVRIGNANTLLEPGVYTYSLTYRTIRWIRHGETSDQLYWNVTGNGWDFPILQASAAVSLPERLSSDQVTLEGWTGPEGSTGSSYTSVFDPDRGSTGAAIFRTTEPLGPREGLTIRITFPTGVVLPPTEEQRAAWFRLDWGQWLDAGLVVAMVLAVYLLLWHRVGRDPDGRPVMVRYQPPEGFSPAGLGYVMERGHDNRHLTAAVVDLAVRGWLEIERAGSSWILRRSGDTPEDAPPSEEALLLRRLFGETRASVGGEVSGSEGGSRAGTEVVLERSPDPEVRKAAKAFRSDVGRRLEKRYFLLNRGWFLVGLAVTVAGFAALAWRVRYSIPEEGWFMGLWLTFWTMGTGTLVWRVAGQWGAALTGHIGQWIGAVFLTLFATPFVVAEIVVAVLLWQAVPQHLFGSALVLGGLNVLFYHLLERPTLKGRGVLDEAEGFRRFLTSTEEDRIRRLQPAAESLALFERFLPWAIALGVESEWAEHFEDALAAEAARPSSTGAGLGGRPGLSWYAGDSGASLSGLTSSLGSSLSSSLSASSAAPSSSGGGGGGGGSSGGGGGGGGGGGW
jgi:uncharacterized membrane protein YgcG